MNLPSEDSTSSPIFAPAVPSLIVAHGPEINYAFQQNAIPVVKEFRFQNDDVVRKDRNIRVTTEPALATPAEGRVQAIAASVNPR